MVKRLTLEETLENLKKWREYGDEDALTLLVLSNQGLVKHFARKYGNNIISSEDLESIGNEALIRAIHRFDYMNRAINCFPSYITSAIEHQISVEFRNNNKHNHVLSFNQPIFNGRDGDSINLENTISYDAEKDFYSKIKATAIADVLSQLTERQRQILILRYGLQDRQIRTLEEVGEILGCTRQSIFYQEQKALQILRKPMYAEKLGGFITD